MPNPANYDNEDDWMEVCVPTRIEEGDDQDQAVAACLSMWRERDKAKARGDGQGMDGERQGDGGAGMCVCPECGAEAEHERSEPCAEIECPECGARMAGTDKALHFEMLLTKAERMRDGRTRWQARANTGKFDLEGDRFANTFWQDVVRNFGRVQEAVTRGEDVGLPVPILDIAHYSFRLPAEKRGMAQAGYPIKVWQDGSALMAQGYFCDTPLGQAAAKAAASRPVAERRVSVGVWPDWGRVELDTEGRRTFKGGRGRAFLDHLAMTAHPIDPGTILEVKAMSEAQKRDAMDVLGDGAEELVDELEQATTKAQPDGAVIKADEEQEQAPEQKAEPETEAEPDAEESEPDQAEAPDAVTMEQLRELMQTLFDSFGKAIDERLAPFEKATDDIEALKAQVDALGTTEAEKVKAAIDSDGDWWAQLVKNSVQRRQPVEDGGPQESTDTGDPFYQVFGGLRGR
jgi:hypothetical protein